MFENDQLILTGRRVLVVDDNVVNLKVLIKVLESNGYQTLQAACGQDALVCARAELPDLILLDIQMPDMDGFTVCRKLKEDPKTVDIPVIFITASDTVESKVEGFKVGGADYIPRPIQMAEVLARVRNQLFVSLAQQKLEQEGQRLKSILGALPVPYMISSVTDSRVLAMNKPARDMLEIEDNDLSGRKTIGFYKDKLHRRELLEEALTAGGLSDVELELITDKGRSLTALISATRLTLDNEDAFFLAFNDITTRKEMEKALEKLAKTDPLTGAFNRRAFSEQAYLERSRCDRNGMPISLLLLDIDYFKSINDTRGHDVGDIALKEMVRLIEGGLRTADVLGRMGGEEFAVLLPETDKEGAFVLAERIRTDLESFKIKIPGQEDLSMTVSGGMTTWQKGQSFDEVFKSVDEKLYAAKRGGRNRIVA